MIFQNESGACTGRGFGDVDVEGYLAKFKAWIVKTPANGGPGWQILLDKSANPVPKTVEAVNTSTERITITGHGFYTNEVVIYSTTGTVIGGLTNNATYRLRKIDNDTFELYLNKDTCIESVTPINLTSSGSGTHTFVLQGPYIVVSNKVPSGINDNTTIILSVGYTTLISATVNLGYWLSFDTTNKILNGAWNYGSITTVDSGNFAYYFSAGDECALFASRVTTTWTYLGIDTWTSVTGFCEADTVIGTLQSAATAGSNVVIQLDVDEAALFTVNKWYYIYDFNGKNRVNYVKCTAHDIVNHTITLQTLNNDMGSGARIGAYPHRFVWGRIPYVSYSPHPFYRESSGFNGYLGSILNRTLESLDRITVTDDGDYLCMRPIIMEYKRPNLDDYYSDSELGQNRAYGRYNNYVLIYSTMAQMLDTRTLQNGIQYIKINSANNPSTLFRYSEELT
jgi:hypothetical protein